MKLQPNSSSATLVLTGKIPWYIGGRKNPTSQEDEKPRSGFRDFTTPCESFSLPLTTFQQPPGPTHTLCDVSTLALLSLNFEDRRFVAVTTYRCRVRFRQPANLVNLELSHFYSQSTIPDLRFIRLRHFNVPDFYY